MQPAVSSVSVNPVNVLQQAESSILGYLASDKSTRKTRKFLSNELSDLRELIRKADKTPAETLTDKARYFRSLASNPKSFLQKRW